MKAYGLRILRKQHHTMMKMTEKRLIFIMTKMKTFLSLFIVFFVLAGNSHAFEAKWTQISESETKIIKSLWLSPKGTLFAVGDSGTIISYDNGEIRFMDSGVEKDLNSVFGINQENIFAVGEEGVILRYDGARWLRLASDTDKSLYGVWGSSESDFFAAGRKGTILHYNGTNWQKMDSGVTKTLYTIWGNSGSDVFAAGGGGVVLHYNGSKWNPIDSGTKYVFKSLWGMSGTDLFAGGNLIFSHYDGRKWNTLRSDNLFLKSLWAESPEKIFAASYDSKEKTNAVIWYDGKNWNIAGSKWDERINAVTGNSGSDIFAAGGDEDNGGIIRHYDGKNWETVWSLKNDSQLSMLNGVWCFSPSDIYAVGTNGVIIHYDGNKWMPVETPADVDLTDIWAKSRDDIYVTGAKGTVLHFDGEKWSQMESKTEADLNGIFGIKGDTEPDIQICAVGNEGTILIYDGSSWSEKSNKYENDLEDVWAWGKNNFVIAGREGVILYYDGKNIIKMDSGTDWPLIGIWGSSANDIYAAGLFTTVLHYDGIKWSPVDIGTDRKIHFRGIWGVNSHNIFITGENGEIVNYNGKSWNFMESGTGFNIYDICGTYGDGKIPVFFAVGDNNGIYEYKRIFIDLPETLKEGDPDVQKGEVIIDAPLKKDLIISLVSDDPDEISIPENITIPAGQTSAFFNISVIDDDLKDGTQDILITANAKKFNSGAAIIKVYDNESAVITLDLPEKFNEMDGLVTGMCQVLTDMPVDKDVVVSLESDNPGAIKVPSYVVIPKGSDHVFFDVLIMDDDEIDDAETAIITASVSGWTSCSVKAVAEDDDMYKLSLKLPKSIRENRMAGEYQGIVSVPMAFDYDISVSLESSDISELTVPEKVTISKGSTYAVFDITPVKDYIVDNPQSVLVTASSPGFLSVWDTIKVEDGDSMWEELQRGSMNLKAVWGPSPDDIFAVGWDGFILHNDGTGWAPFDYSRFDSYIIETNFRCIWGASENDIFIGGSDGVIIHYDGIKWEKMETGIQKGIYGIWGISGSDVFAVGYSFILHYDGEKWNNMNIPVKGYLYAIWGSSASDIFVAGTRGIILHYNGETWARMETGIEDSITLRSIWGSGPGNVFAAGESAILHWDGNAWEPMDVPVANYYDIWGFSGDNVFAVGNDGIIIRYDGKKWNIMESGTTQLCDEIWGYGDKYLYVVGISGTILFFDGEKWSVSQEPYESFNGVWAAPSGSGPGESVFVVGGGGVIRHYDGKSWKLMEKGFFQDLFGIWGRYESDVYAVGDKGTILYYNGTVWRKMESGTYEKLNDIWGLPPETGPDLFVAGDNGTVLHYDGSAWITMETGVLEDLHGVWAVPSENNMGYEIFAVGKDGLILRFDGNEWIDMHSGTNDKLLDICGISSDNIYVVGNSGSFLHYDGISWTRISGLKNLSIQSIWINSPQDIFIAGKSGLIYHYDGEKWIRMSAPDKVLTGIYGNSAGYVYATGWHNTFIRYNPIKIIMPRAAKEGDGLIEGAGIVKTSRAPENDLELKLTSHDPEEITVPEFVTIKAGKKSAVFDIFIKDDDLVDGTQTVPVTACAEGWNTGTAYINVQDNETASLTVELAKDINENDGTVDKIGIVRMDKAAEKDVKVNLIGENSKKISLPESITIPKGGNSAEFSVSVPDNIKFVGTESINITAYVDGWENGSAVLNVLDNKKALLSLSIPKEVNENAGNALGTVSTDGILPYYDLEILLSTDSPLEITVPQSVILPKGEMSVDFNMGILDNHIIDGTRDAGITAIADGWTEAVAQMEIIDNDPGVLSFSLPKYMAWRKAGTVTIPVIRKQSSDGEISVSYHTEDDTAFDGTDYKGVSGILTFASGETQKSFDIPVISNPAQTGPVSLNIILSDPEKGASLTDPSTASLVIADSMVWKEAVDVPASSCHLRGIWGNSKGDISCHLKGIWGNSKGDIYAVGYRSTILYYNGREWSDVSLSTGKKLFLEAVWVSRDSDVVVVGQEGIIMTNTAKGGWEFYDLGIKAPLYAVWGTSYNDIFAGGSGIIIHFDGKTWEKMDVGSSWEPDIRGLWGTGPEDVFAVGYDGLILHYDGKKWEKMNSPTENHLYAIRGFSCSDIFAVGAMGEIIHYDGKKWEIMAKNFPDFVLFLDSVWGCSGKDVFAGGYNGIILHYDGEKWEKMESPTEKNINGLWGPPGTGSALDIFGICDNGVIINYGPGQ